MPRIRRAEPKILVTPWLLAGSPKSGCRHRARYGTGNVHPARLAVRLHPPSPSHSSGRRSGFAAPSKTITETILLGQRDRVQVGSVGTVWQVSTRQRALSIRRSNRKCARSGPSFSSTLSSASFPFLGFLGSTSGFTAMVLGIRKSGKVPTPGRMRRAAMIPASKQSTTVLLVNFVLFIFQSLTVFHYTDDSPIFERMRPIDLTAGPGSLDPCVGLAGKSAKPHPASSAMSRNGPTCQLTSSRNREVEPEQSGKQAQRVADHRQPGQQQDRRTPARRTIFRHARYRRHRQATNAG